MTDEVLIKESFERALAEGRAESPDWIRRWRLSLAVGNGAGLIATASGLLSLHTADRDPYLLIPPAWAFAAGVILAGLIPPLAALAANRTVVLANTGLALHRQEHADPLDDAGLTFADLKAARDAARTAARRVGLAASASAAAFIAGVVMPLLQITLGRV